MNDCRRFVADVIADADAVAAGTPVAQRARALAERLVAAHVPALQVLGLDLHRALVGPEAAERIARAGDGAPLEPCARGFRRGLVAGGQDGEAIRHLAAAAAAVLMNREYLVTAASAVDRAQGLLRNNPIEARAEIAGNRAGAELGALLLEYLAGRIERAALESAMRRLLCAEEDSAAPP